MSPFFKPFFYLIVALSMAASVIAALEGIYWNEIFSLKYVIVLLFLLIAILKQQGSSKHNFITMLNMVFVFAITQFHYFPIVTMCIPLYLLHGWLIKYKNKEASRLITVQTGFNFMNDVLSVGLALFFFRNAVGVIGNIGGVILASFTINILNFTLVNIAMMLYSNVKYNMHANEAVHKVFNDIFTSIILVYAYNAYSYFGAIIIYLFIMSFSSYILMNLTNDSLLDEVYKDALTGAFNRGYLDKTVYDRLVQKIPFGIVFLDLDQFKRINDQYGYIIGDELLAHFTTFVSNHVSPADKVFRYGGDEFCIFLNAPEDTEQMIEKLNHFKQNLKFISVAATIPYSFSVGLYIYSGIDHVRVSDVLKHASEQMKLNKRNTKVKQL